jgi:hypothetical protein
VAALEKAAESMGLVVAAEHRYVDEGYSGSRLDRPGLDALRDAAAEGLLDLVGVRAILEHLGLPTAGGSLAPAQESIQDAGG